MIFSGTEKNLDLHILLDAPHPDTNETNTLVLTLSLAGIVPRAGLA